MTEFQRILVANRGEIARRIFRTCRDLGIDTVAVFSDADADMPFVAEADTAVRIGPAASAESYLVIDKIIDAAKRSGADAIHPGYGFLSENAEFAEACAKAGIKFIGPTAYAIRAMGLKRESKAMVAAAGVPVVPGYADSQDDADLIAAAPGVGFPLLVKASAGGGGKGMRVVQNAEELPEALAGARREAAAAFADDTVILERYVQRPRHVEIQVLGDNHGNVVHLFERECTIQRRHQKVIEESPSPALNDELRQRMGDAAVAAAKAVDYNNAGTVEFILGEDMEFFFLEMNTRLQVEHPVTECVTGVDLVAEQIWVAQGQPLRFKQEDLTQNGAALECRIYAEDPANNFFPATGTLHTWKRPDYPWLRIDAGVESGDEVSVHYDPMIAKVITSGVDSSEARRRMLRALREMSFAGITTNRAFLVNVLQQDRFADGDYDTHFIAEHADALRVEMSDETILRFAAAAALAAHGERERQRTLLPGVRPGYRNVFNHMHTTKYSLGDRDIEIGYRAQRSGGFDVQTTWTNREGAQHTDLETASVVSRSRDELVIELAGVRERYFVVRNAGRVTVHTLQSEVVFTEHPRFPEPGLEEVEGGCLAPMPGKIIAVAVSVGDTVTAGQTLVVLEAMKMEHSLTAPEDGVIAEVRVCVGEQVDADEVLVVLGDE
ncbi:MAG: acetyl-CoA carboxylase biotin carboxylase subunit [Bradymonadia bacterium]|jgi:acetyl-CoA carboxylase biotin carboxylase subunit